MTVNRKQPQIIDDDALDAVRGGAQTAELQRLPVGSVRKITGDDTTAKSPTVRNGLFEGCYKYD